MVRFRTNVIATNNNTNIIATIVLYGKIFYRICDWKFFLLLFLFFIFESRFHASVKKKKEKLQFTSILSLTSYLNFFPSIFFFLFLILFLREDFLQDLISFYFYFFVLYSELERRDIYIFFLESSILFLFFNSIFEQDFPL